MQGARAQNAAADNAGTDQVRVLVVDDSAVVRGLTKRLLEADAGILVVDTAADGEQAVRSAERIDVDVVVLDIEMPKMDGMTALPLLLKAHPNLKVIMSSTLTTRNADTSVTALRMGAADYIAKPTSSKEIHGGEEFRRDLTAKVLALGGAAKRRRRRASGARNPAARTAPTRSTAAAQPVAAASTILLRNIGKFTPEVLALGSSTGGPQALLSFFKELDQAFDLPILITQHMPATFTKILATHIAQSSGRPCVEAEGGENIAKGNVYVAPGGKHMLVKRDGTGVVIRLSDDPPENFCKPAVDPMLRSVVEVYGPKVLTAIFTGMGQDGLKGCRAVVEAGGTVIGQDEETSVVWGMPGAVATNGLCSAILPLCRMAGYVSNFSNRKTP